MRHPGVVRELQTDFALLRCLASAVAMLPGLRWLDIEATVAQFEGTLSQQATLQAEGAHLTQMRRHFGAWRDVEVPRPLLATPSVLVESFIDATPLSFYMQRGRARVLLSRSERHYIVQRGVDIYLKMLLQDNLMHADLHPGNILFAREPHPTIAIVDLGLVAVLSAEEQRNFIGFLHALGRGDGARAAACVLGWSRRQACTRRAEFTEAMRAYFATSCRGYGTGIHLGNVLRAVLELVRLHRVTIAGNYMTLVVNALCLEGVARELEPGYNVLDGAKPLLDTRARACTRTEGALARSLPPPRPCHRSTPRTLGCTTSTWLVLQTLCPICPTLHRYGAMHPVLFRAALPGLSLMKRMVDRRTTRRLDAHDRTRR